VIPIGGSSDPPPNSCHAGLFPSTTLWPMASATGIGISPGEHGCAWRSASMVTRLPLIGRPRRTTSPTQIALACPLGCLPARPRVSGRITPPAARKARTGTPKWRLWCLRAAVLLRHATGAAPLAGGDYCLTLFHITNPSAFAAIKASRQIWASKWNLQGTRKLSNVGYAYLTSLSSVSGEDDLRRIAMSSDGVIHFQTTSPRAREEVLDLAVYRESTTGRTAALPIVVPTAALAPPHLLLHPP